MRRAALVTALCGAVALASAAPSQEASLVEPSAALPEPLEPAAVPEPPAKPDIIVRGRGYGALRLQIRLAEEEIFARFNDINSTDDFDIHCQMDPMLGSRIRTRLCQSNSWREQDANYAQATLRRMRGEGGPDAQQFRAEQLRMQRLLANEVRRLAFEDAELGEAVVRLGQAQLALADRTGRRSEWTEWREVAAGADGALPFAAERMFEVHIGRQRWPHLLTGRTFTIAQVSGDIRSLSLDCNERDEKLDYETDVDWTLPANLTSCILLVRAKKDTTFALYEF